MMKGWYNLWMRKRRFQLYIPRMSDGKCALDPYSVEIDGWRERSQLEILSEYRNVDAEDVYKIAKQYDPIIPKVELIRAWKTLVEFIERAEKDVQPMSIIVCNRLRNWPHLDQHSPPLLIVFVPMVAFSKDGLYYVGLRKVWVIVEHVFWIMKAVAAPILGRLQ